MRARSTQRGGFALNAAGLVAAGPGSFRLPVLPWTVAAADERRFKGILTFCLAGALMLALALRVITLPPPDRSAAPVLPPPMARLILERQAAPPAPPAPPAPTPKPEAAKNEARSETVAQAPAAPERPQPPRRAPAPAAAARQPVEGQAPGEVALEQARRKAASSGLLALKNELSALAAAPAAVQLQQETARPAPGVGTTSGPGAGAGSEAGEPARALVTAAAGRTSGGIGAAGTSRDSGGGGLPGRATTVLPGGGGLAAGGGGAGGASGMGGPGAKAGGSAAGVGSGAGGGPGAGAEAVAGGKPSAVKAAVRATRSLEDIKLVFERQKGAIYALYNRALRDDPSLQGKVVVELKIAPAGHVDSVRIVSSELKSEELEKKLLARIRSFDFGARDVDALVLTWPLDFLPG